MKKILLLAVCLMVIGMQSVNAQLLTVALHHNGKVTIYGSDQLSTAMNDAVAGDSMFLSEGSYPQKLTITRAISVIGTGAAGAITEIRGSIEIAIPDTLSHVGCQLRDIKTTTLSITKPVDSLRITKCLFTDEMKFSGLITNAIIDRSHIKSFILSTTIGNMDIITSKIKWLAGTTNSASSANFAHCDISLINNGYGNSDVNMCLATYLNCIIGRWRVVSSYIDINAIFINCLCRTDTYTKYTYQNCWVNGGITFDDDDNVTLTSGDLSNYIGTDGTVVGSTGSANPYTLVPNTPHVTDAKLDVDSKTKKLIVTMSVE